MALLKRREPETALSSLSREMERFFDEMRGFSMPAWMGGEGMFPPVEVGETEKEFFVKAQVPGMRKEDIRVEIADGSLTLRGETREEREEEGKSFYRREFQYGHFSRTIPLPSGADASKAAADMHEGILEVHLPKTEEARKRAVKVPVK